MRAADLKTDTIVEVKCSADGDLEPPSWWEAKVRSVKGEFVNLQFLDAAATKEVAELDRIRPAYSSQASKLSSTIRRTNHRKAATWLPYSSSGSRRGQPRYQGL